MNSNKINIDQLLATSYAGYQPAVPALAWEGIAAKLDNSRKPLGFVWWKVAIIAAFISGASVFIIHNFKLPVQQSNSANSGPVLKNNTVEPNSRQLPGIQNSDEAVKNATSDKLAQPNSTNGVVDQINRPLSGNRTLGNPSITTTNRVEEQVVDISSKPLELIKSFKLAVFGIKQSKINGDVNGIATLGNTSGLFVQLPVMPNTNMGLGKIFIGAAVGQIVSNTGYSINSKFASYVHKDFKSRISEGEGLLSSLNFSGVIGIGLSKNVTMFTGASWLQRKNSVNFDFTVMAPTTSAVGGKEADKFGNYPIVAYNNPKDINYKGTNTFSQTEIPLGLLYNVTLNKNWSLMPSISGNFGFITQRNGKTLDYSKMNVVEISNEWYRKTYFSMGFSAGLYRSLGEDFKIGVSGSTSFMLTQMYIPGATIKPRALTGGLSTQLIWRLTK